MSIGSVAGHSFTAGGPVDEGGLCLSEPLAIPYTVRGRSWEMPSLSRLLRFVFMTVSFFLWSLCILATDCQTELRMVSQYANLQGNPSAMVNKINCRNRMMHAEGEAAIIAIHA